MTWPQRLPRHCPAKPGKLGHNYPWLGAVLLRLSPVGAQLPMSAPDLSWALIPSLASLSPPSSMSSSYRPTELVMGAVSCAHSDRFQKRGKMLTEKEKFDRITCSFPCNGGRSAGKEGSAQPLLAFGHFWRLLACCCPALEILRRK